VRRADAFTAGEHQREQHIQRGGEGGGGREQLDELSIPSPKSTCQACPLLGNSSPRFSPPLHCILIFTHTHTHTNPVFCLAKRFYDLGDGFRLPRREGGRWVGVDEVWNRSVSLSSSLSRLPSLVFPLSSFLSHLSSLVFPLSLLSQEMNSKALTAIRNQPWNLF